MAGNRAVRPLSGWLTFAAVIMFIVGFHNLIYGIAALRDYTVVVNNLNGGANVLYADTNFWGALWIAIGIVEMALAYGIYIRNDYARWAGIAIAAINAIGQLAFVAAFPVWSVIIIVIDILVIYALCTYDSAHGRFEEPYPDDRAGVGEAAGRGAGVGNRATETAGVRPGSGGFTGRGGRGEPRGGGHGDEGLPPTVNR
ncbi:DUF7144 family membrane protein [Candidatus Frankia alpina]|uniref:DUF7144 family membrane protein n=1 Tax=Candidatus Frankia alpina TaxID=2699483 RepID=UPI0013D684A0|nr:hypothetical protein [Candidatus Frankia alpina]